MSYYTITNGIYYKVGGYEHTFINSYKKQLNTFMKPLIFILISFITLVFSQPIKADTADKILDKTGAIIDSTTTAIENGVTYVDTSSTYKMLYSDIKSGITALASSLKVGAEHVYGILIKQQRVNSVIYLLIFIIGAFLINNFINKYKNGESKEWGDWEDGPSGLGVLRIIQLAFAFILFTIGLRHIDVIITGLINPEYGAIKEILTIVSGKTNL